MPQWHRRRWFTDLVFVAIVAAGGFVIGSRYVEAFHRTDRGFFDQKEFSPAVMLACGRGYASPAVSTPALDRFLAGEVDTFSCDQLTPQMTPGGLSFMQALYRYLMTAVAWQWRWSGISWSGLTPLFGIVFALTLCAAYGLFRLAAPPIAALLAVVPLAVSAHHLGFLPQLRDYAKAPFILLLILIIARIAIPPLERRRALLLAAAFGLVLGIGFGFRNDLLINIPPFVACVVLFLPGRFRDNLWLKGSCLAVALVVFVVSAWPIISGYRSGSNSGHVAVLGLTSTFDAPLGLTRPIYNLGPHYLDGYAAMMIIGDGRLHGEAPAEFTTPEYDAAAARFVGEVARHWPADIAARGLASALKIIELPFTVDTLTPATPRGLTAPWLMRFYAWQGRQLQRIAPFAPWAVPLSVIVIGASNWRAGIAVGMLVLYYAGYPALQFSVRHYFHLEFIAWWALVFLIIRAIHVRRVTPAFGRNAAVMAAAMLFVLASPLVILRAYQQRHVAALVDGYLQAHRTPIAIDEVWANHNASDPVDVRYLALEFSSDRCAAANVPATIKYESKTAANDFTYVADVEISSSGPTWRFVPVYYNGQWSHFTGIGLPAGSEGCLKSVNRIDDLSAVPIYLDLELAPGWRQTKLFQRIAALEN